MNNYPNAIVHPDAQIGGNVTIDPFAIVHADVVIGDGTWIGPHAVIMNGARIGKNCKIHPSAVISGEPQDLKFDGEKSTAEIGDNTTVRECCTVNRGTAASGKLRTVVGSNCLLMSYCHVAHDCNVGNHVIMSSFVGLGGEVEVGDHAILGGGVLAHQFSKIGAHSMTGGGVTVFKDVPPYVLTGHNPPSFFGINRVGLQRRGFSSEQIEHIHGLYRIIYQSSMNVSQACEELRKLPQSAECDEVLKFIASSKRGIIGRAKD